MQRLFSTFANGWPGAGILLQRGLAGYILLYCGTLYVLEKPHGLYTIPKLIGAVAGLFLLIGLWTPIAGALAFLAEAGAILAGAQEPAIAFVSGTLSATIAMIGPGAWSLDARIFGRKHIETRLSAKSSTPPLH